MKINTHFLIVHRLIIPRMMNISYRTYRENQNTSYAKQLFKINRAVYEIMWKNIVELNRPQNDNTVHAHCMLDTQGYKHTLRMYNICCFSTVTMFARTRLIVVLYVHYPSCSCCLYLSLQ